MCTSEANAKKAFEVLNEVLGRYAILCSFFSLLLGSLYLHHESEISVHEETPEAHDIFGSYADNIFDLTKVGESYAFEVLVKQYLNTIRGGVCYYFC